MKKLENQASLKQNSTPSTGECHCGSLKIKAKYKVGDDIYYKCDSCYKKNPKLENYQRCEVYSRIVGYMRPVNQWNKGKQAEYHNRKLYDLR